MNKMSFTKFKTHARIFAGLVPSGPPTIEMLFSLTSDVNLQIQTQVSQN